MSSTSQSKRPRVGKRKPESPGLKTGRDTVSALETHLGYWLRMVSNHVSHAFKVKVEKHGVTVAEWVVLRALFDDDGIKSSQLAVKLGLSRGAISKLVERLTAKDLVAVRADPRDGRAHFVTLCASGRRLVPKLAALADENDKQAFGHLNHKQRSFLLGALRGIVDRLDLRRMPVD